MLTLAFVQIGVDFSYHKNFNDLLEVEWMGGDTVMTEEERYRCDQLRPETGGQYFRAQLKGAGYWR